MPIYAGGIEILAADYCKAMSNLWVPCVSVELLFRQRYFTERLLAGGEQQAEYPENETEDLAVSSARDAGGMSGCSRWNSPGTSSRAWSTRPNDR